QPVIDFITRGLKIVVSVLAVLMLLEAVGVQVSALIAAIGVGGIGIAFAAQRTVENLFGGLAVVGDRPVQEGDFCKIGQQQGTVERLGLWSTRVRTPDRSVITIPNAQFLTLQVENLQQRDRILFNTNLRLRYETTPDQLRWILVRTRELLDAHPRVDPDTSRVRFSGFGESSLDLELFVYVRTRDGNEFLAVREDLCLRVMDIVTAAGTAFALPARTHYSEAVGLDPERAGAATAEVQRWRSEGKLPLPDFPLKRESRARGRLLLRRLVERYGEGPGVGDLDKVPGLHQIEVLRVFRLDGLAVALGALDRDRAGRFVDLGDGGGDGDFLTD